jgi:hypothetical protein
MPEVHQCGAGGADQGGEFLVGGLGAGEDPFQIGDELGGDPAAGIADLFMATHPAAERWRAGPLAWAADRLVLGPPGISCRRS